jgi:hypothetical protein
MLRILLAKASGNVVSFIIFIKFKEGRTEEENNSYVVFNQLGNRVVVREEALIRLPHPLLTACF